MEHVPFIIKNTSQNPIEFSLSDYLDSNDFATWRFSADREISSIDWEAVKKYEEITTIDVNPIYDDIDGEDIDGEDTDNGLEEGYSEKTFRLMPGEAISLRNVSKVGTVCNPHFNIVDKGLTFDGSLLSLLPGGKMTKECFVETFSDCIGLTETPSFSDINEVPQGAFMFMFASCINLEKVSEIVATKFGESACDGMFCDCISLKKPADMPNAKEFDKYAFSRMYYFCSSLKEMADCPKVDIIPEGCFCLTYAETGITEMKPLPALKVGEYAFMRMFEACTNLEKASEIAAKEFGGSACDRMFKDCTSLKKPANMPNCQNTFENMYEGCPLQPATKKNKNNIR